MLQCLPLVIIIFSMGLMFQMVVHLYHICFTPMTMFIGNQTNSNFINLVRILRCFHASAGLKVNFHKSKVFSNGVLDNDILTVVEFLGMSMLLFLPSILESRLEPICL